MYMFSTGVFNLMHYMWVSGNCGKEIKIKAAC